jgi:hypothetical protein
LVRLKEDTKPSLSHMRKLAQQQYSDALKPLRQQRQIGQWLERWEHAMVIAIKYKLRQTKDGMWLQDLAEVIKPFSESLYTKYLSYTEKPEEHNPTSYRTIAKELRLALHTKKAPSTSTMRGTAFIADFAGETEDGDPADESTQASGKSLSRKRAGTTTVEQEAPQKKKSKKSTCPACERKGHNLPDCWYLFEDKRPEDFKVVAKRLKQTLERVKNNKDLAAQVEKLRLERGETVEVDEA